MSQVVRGSSGVTEQPMEWGWSPTGGAWAQRSWEAAGEAGKAYLRGFANSLRDQNIEHRGQDSFGKGRLTAIYGNENDGRTEVPVSVWEVRVNRVSKDFFQTPAIYQLKDFSFTGYVANAGETLFDILKQCVQAATITDAQLADVDTANDAAQKVFFESFNLAQSGSHEFIVEQAVVVLSQTVSSQYARTAASTNAGKVLTMAQMISLEGAPSVAVEDIALPAGLPAPADSATGYGFIYGYRKSRPEMHQTAYNKWQMVTQWEQGFWSTLLYSGV